MDINCGKVECDQHKNSSKFRSLPEVLAALGNEDFWVSREKFPKQPEWPPVRHRSEDLFCTWTVEQVTCQAPSHSKRLQSYPSDNSYLFTLVSLLDLFSMSKCGHPLFSIIIFHVLALHFYSVLSAGLTFAVLWDWQNYIHPWRSSAKLRYPKRFS